MAIQCGAATRDGTACQRHVRAEGVRCFQHRRVRMSELTRAPVSLLLPGTGDAGSGAGIGAGPGTSAGAGAGTGAGASVGTSASAGPPLDVPDFMVPGFPPEPVVPDHDRPMRTAMHGVLGPVLWQRCAAEWSAGHCAELARIARTVDGMAPAATTSILSTAGIGLRLLGATKERDQLAGEVATAVGQPDDLSVSNAARTLRLYGAAICLATGIGPRRCTCRRDLMRDVSPELIQQGLDGLTRPEI